MQVYKHRGRVIHSQLILSPVAAGCNVQRPFHSRYACEVSNGAQRAPMSALKRIDVSAGPFSYQPNQFRMTTAVPKVTKANKATTSQSRFESQFIYFCL